MIRRWGLAVALFAAAMGSIAIAVMASTAEEKSSQSPVEQIQRLQDKVKQLEARVAALEKKQHVFVVPPTSSAPLAPAEPLPKGWQEHRFNGLRYFIVPLAENKNGGAGRQE